MPLGHMPVQQFRRAVESIRVADVLQGEQEIRPLVRRRQVVAREGVEMRGVVSHRSVSHHNAARWRLSPLPPVPRESAARSRSRSEEHTSELQSLMRISYAVFCLKKKKKEKFNIT